MENSNINFTPEVIAQIAKLLGTSASKQQNSNLIQDEYADYIYIKKEARYYSKSLRSLFTRREIISNLQASTGDISITEKNILDAQKDGRIKAYNDFCFGDDEEGRYNLYDNSLILKADMENPNLHPLIQELLEDVTNGNSADMEYILKWIGWKYLHPLSPMCSGLILKGAQGSGKGHIVTLAQTIFGNEHTRVNISPENFSSRFTSIDEQTLVCELSEQGETDYKTIIRTSTKLKTLVMQNELQIENKYEKLRTIHNHTAYIITSNRQIPLMLDDKSIGNRRYSFFQGDKIYNDIKGSQVRSVITDKTEVARLLGYILYNWGDELKSMSVCSAHKNEIKDILEQSAGNEFQQFWGYLRETNMGELVAHTQMRKEFEKFCKDNGYSHDRLKSKLLRECPWREVRPDNEMGEQGERHRLVQPIGGNIKGGGLHKLIPQDKQTEGISNSPRELVPVSLKELENIF